MTFEEFTFRNKYKLITNGATPVARTRGWYKHMSLTRGGGSWTLTHCNLFQEVVLKDNQHEVLVCCISSTRCSTKMQAQCLAARQISNSNLNHTVHVEVSQPVSSERHNSPS